jgi:two-component system alkaline phosphatase synthesis response regulator PhoP
MESTKLVIIVEDEEALLDSYSEVVEDMGYSFIKCKDGYKGLDALAQNKDQVSIMILDLMMEGIDGLEVLRNIKEAPDKYGDVPVIVLTSMVSERAIQECLELGAKSYLIKTEVSSDDLEREIKKFII